MLPPSEWTIDWLRRFHYVYAGSVSDVRRVMDTLVEAGVQSTSMAIGPSEQCRSVD
jgi:hypothetical protein